MPETGTPVPPAAQAAELRKVYGSGQTAVVALDGVSATFPAGEFTAVMGPSGSGKSTFMHCLAGLDTATSGEVYVGGDRLSGMSDKRLTHRPTELSGGQQQRVACARALITKPAVVFADEPTGNLDSHSSAEVLAFLRRSVDELGQTVVIVTHEPSAAAYADRVLFLADGRIVDELRGPTADSVLDRMKGLEPGHETLYTPVGA